MAKVWGWIWGAGGFLLSLLLAWKLDAQGERTKRAEATIKKREQNQKKGDKLEKEYQDISATTVADRLNRLR
jgi:hypothetical protein